MLLASNEIKFEALFYEKLEEIVQKIVSGATFTPLFHFSHRCYMRHVHKYASLLCALIK